MKENVQVCSSCVLDGSFPGIGFDEKGTCSVCRSYVAKHADALRQKELLPEKRAVLDGICADAKAKKRAFDVLVPLSGGKDSMYVLYLAVKELGLRPLAFTMDNGYLSPYARENIDRACSILGVEHIYYCMDPRQMRDLFALFMRKTGYFCSICMRAIGMATEKVAEMYDIPLVFGGSASKVELPTAPEMFQNGNPKFVANVLAGEPRAHEYRRLLYSGPAKRRWGYNFFWWGAQKKLGSYAWVNLPDYFDWDYATMFSTIQKELGWRTASGKEEEHMDCLVHLPSEYIHNRRWKGSEIRRLTYAGMIMAGQMGREEALRKLESEPPKTYSEEDLQPFLSDIGMTKEEFDRCIDAGPRYVAYRPRPGAGVDALRRIKKTAFKVLGVKRV